MTLTPTLQNAADIVVKVGKVPSLNAFYAAKHWAMRKKAKDKFKAEILEQLEAYDKITFKSVSVKLEVNYRYDIDNSVMACKFAMDAFKEWGGIQDDSPKYFKRLLIVQNTDLEADTAKIIFSEPL